jgi:hypothetical protein
MAERSRLPTGLKSSRVRKANPATAAGLEDQQRLSFHQPIAWERVVADYLRAMVAPNKMPLVSAS